MRLVPLARLALSLLLALPALASCDRADPTDAAPTGIYVLVRTADGEVPAVLGTRAGCTYRAEAGHVALMPQQRYEAMLIRSRQCETPEMGTDTAFRDQGLGTYEVAQDSLVFQQATGEPAGVGRFQNDTLVVQGPGQTLFYTRDEELSRQAAALDSAAARSPR